MSKRASHHQKQKDYSSLSTDKINTNINIIEESPRVKEMDNKIEEKQTVTATNVMQYSLSIRTDDYIRASLFVKNLGLYNAVVRLEISPDNINYIRDTADMIIMPSQLIVFAQNTYTKYIRICFKTNKPPTESNLEIIFQGKK